MTQTINTRLVFFGLFPFACGYFLSYLLRAVNAVVAPDLVRDFGVGPAELGLLTSAYLLSFSIVQLPLGVLLDRYGARRVQSALLLVAAAGVLWFSFATSVAQLFLARALIGIGFAAGLMASFKSSADWLSAERRAFINPAIMSMGALGLVAATEPTKWLVDAMGWRHAFQVFAVVIAVAAAFVWLAVPRAHEGQQGASFKTQWSELVAILKLPLFWRLAPITGVASGIPIAYQTLWAAPWFRDVMGLNRDEVARNLFFMAVAFMIGILLVGFIADQLQRRGVGIMKTFVGIAIIHSLAQAVIAFQILPLAIPAWIILAAVGQSAILSFPWFAARVGKNIAGRSNATINFAMFVCAFAAQYLAGVIISFWPATATGYDARAYFWCFVIFLAVQVAALIWYLLTPKHLLELPS